MSQTPSFDGPQHSFGKWSSHVSSALVSMSQTFRGCALRISSVKKIHKLPLVNFRAMYAIISYVVTWAHGCFTLIFFHDFFSFKYSFAHRVGNQHHQCVCYNSHNRVVTQQVCLFYRRALLPVLRQRPQRRVSLLQPQSAHDAPASTGATSLSCDARRTAEHLLALLMVTPNAESSAHYVLLEKYTWSCFKNDSVA